MAKETKPVSMFTAEPEPVSQAAMADPDKAKFDELVRAKVAAGLPREDAEAVARKQIDQDNKSK